MKVCFLADGNYEIGLGHVMRCITLAREFRKRGFSVYFLSKCEEGILKIKENKFDLLNKLDNTDIIIIDKYELSNSFFLSMKKYCKIIAYIDDVNEFDYPVDIVINGSLISSELGYIKGNNKILLLGPQYNILRDEFRGMPKRVIRDKVQNIMVTTGGADPFNTTIEIIKLIRSNIKYDNMKLHVVIGSGFVNAEKLKKEIMNYKNIMLYENVKQMSKIMVASDIAFSAGGGTLYELCACGTPTIGLILAQNQELITNRMSQLGYIKSIGWHIELNKKKLWEALDSFIDKKCEREIISAKQQTLVDGRGAERIVNEIDKMLMNKEGDDS